MEQNLLIIGAGGHGKVVADIAANLNRYQKICFIDDAKYNKEVMGYPVIGKSSDYMQWIDQTDFFVAIGDSKVREEYIEKLRNAGAKIATLVHPKAVVGKNVYIGDGTVIMAGTIVNPDSRIGTGVILNTCCSVDHDNQIGDYCHISVGAHLAGNVSVGNHTMVGAGTTVINNISICGDCMIGAGAVVVKDISEKGTYVGVPASSVVRK